MAEERLIDEDKDRKYKIRINEDGEEELVLVEPDNVDEEEESDIPVFDIPVGEEDDEEAVMLTPEQFAERERLKEEEEKNLEEQLEALLFESNKKIEENDFEGALSSACKAEQLAPSNGEVYCVKLKALTRNLTDFSDSEECGKTADGIKQFATEQQKESLIALSAGLKEKISQTQSAADALSVQNEEKKSERRLGFAQNKKRALKILLAAAVPFAALLIATIVLSTMMFADEHGAFLIATIALAAVTFISLILTLAAANKFWSADRNCKLNEKDTSTKLGRDYIKCKTELELLKKVYSSFNNDLS